MASNIAGAFPCERHLFKISSFKDIHKTYALRKSNARHTYNCALVETFPIIPGKTNCRGNVTIAG